MAENIGDLPRIDPITGAEAEIRLVQPFQARKEYLCPRCLRAISAREAHYVVVPATSADLRRHWHKRCLAWELRHGSRNR